PIFSVADELSEGRTAAHEWVGDFEMVERAAFLVVGVINVPDGFSRFALVVRCLHCRRQQHGAKDAGTPSRPPFGHLVDGFTCVALDDSNLIYGDDGKINFETGLGS